MEKRIITWHAAMRCGFDKKKENKRGVVKFTLMDQYTQMKEKRVKILKG